MNNSLTLALSVVLLALLLAIAFFMVDREKFWERLTGSPDLGRHDFEAARRSATANDALACTPGLCSGKIDIELGEFDASPHDLMIAVEKRIAASGEIAKRADDSGDGAYARFITWSPRMRFADTIDIEAVTLANGKTGLRAYARAKFGKLDFGANRQRLSRWLSDLE